LTVEGFTEFYKVFSIVFLGLLGFLFISLVASFKEQQIITITGEFIEIRRKKLFFSSKEILDRKLIEKIDIKELKIGKKNTKSKTMVLPHKIPVFIIYMPVTVNGTKVTFLKDVYNLI
jgi:hypothetical protein